jgi:hypothetical protein
LLWELQSYANNRLGLLPGITSPEQYATVPSEEKLKVRQTLWDDPQLLAAFVAGNPANLPPEALQIVQSWQRRVAGEFYILRYLQRHTIFLSAGEDARVYGVLGLYDHLEAVMLGRPLPIRVRGVLLPFKGRVVYDGLLESYAITFGSGIRSELNELYQRAKQQGVIIESLEPAAPSQIPAKRPKRRDWRPLLDSVAATTEQLRQADTAVQTRAMSVLKASARLAQAAARDPDDLDQIEALAQRTQTALRQLDTALSRAQ